MTQIDNEIRPLVGIRGIATAWVVLFHMHLLLFRMLPSTKPLEDILNSAMLAVDFFFMLSGFIICYRYLDQLSSPSRERTARYLALRFARIWPVHAVMVIAFVLYHWWAVRNLGYGLSADNVDLRNSTWSCGRSCHRAPRSTRPRGRWHRSSVPTSPSR